MLNQAYFMGLFFFLSGCFTPQSYDRKGTLLFFKDRLLRLGIPILIYIFVISPIAKICMGFYRPEDAQLSIPFTLKQYFGAIGIGPLWFVVMLLIFDICYLSWRVVMKNKPEKIAEEPPKIRTVFLFVLVLAFATYLTRIIIPISTYILFFPSLAYFSQYISFFILGIIAFRRDWLNLIPDKLGKTGFISAIAGSIILMPIALSPLSGQAAGFIGGGTWQSGIYSIWDSLFSVGLCLGLLTFFRKHFNHQKNFWGNMQKSCFTVYIIHSVIIIVAAYILDNLQVLQQLKFALASCISVPLCFVIAYFIGKIQIKGIRRP